jgi:hypothetical protein
MKYRIGDLVKWTYPPDEELGIITDTFGDVVCIVWCRSNIRDHYNENAEELILIRRGQDEEQKQ